jgi:hypothetical protein
MAQLITKRFIVASLLVLFAMAVSVFVLELIVRQFYFTDTERNAGAARLWVGFENSYLRSVEAATGCIFTDGITAHPFLSFVYRAQGDCRPTSVNNHGLLSYYDMPQERNPAYFTILLVAGLWLQECT